MAYFIILLGLCSLAVPNPIASAANDVAPNAEGDFSANVTTDIIASKAVSAQIPLSTSYVGCYAEPLGGTRALSRATLKHPVLTIGVCQDFCKGYRYCMLDSSPCGLPSLLTSLSCRRPRVRK